MNIYLAKLYGFMAGAGKQRADKKAGEKAAAA
jgi:hypothetical protein